jgi:hypothetical protein
VRGYTVARPGDLTASGVPVRFSGTKLAADLTWPKLLDRWASTPAIEPMHPADDDRIAPADRRDVLEQIATAASRAAAAIRNSDEHPDGIAHAAGEVLAALARGREGHELGLLTEIAERYDRAARTPHRVLPSHLGSAARDLRQASRRIAAVGALSGRGHEKFALLSLMLALAGLITEIAACQQAHGRVHQAAAARHAARALSAHAQPNDSASTARPLAQITQQPIPAAEPVRTTATTRNPVFSQKIPRLTASTAQPRRAR